MKTVFAIMDARANYDPDEATVFSVCDSKKEADMEKSDYGDDCVVVELEVEG